jgi:signal transduction histidine kinase
MITSSNLQGLHPEPALQHEPLRRLAANAHKQGVESLMNLQHDKLSTLNIELKEDLQERAALLLQLTAEVQERNLELEQRTRQLEERTSELENANRQLESFSYSVSHDLRAPLRAISGFALILAQRHRDSLNPQAQHYLDNIVEASTHMGRLIDDLLSYSRLGRSAIAINPVSLKMVMDQIIRSLQPRAIESGARFDIPQDLPLVQGDATLLSQIFTNLLDNALLYRKAGVPARVTLTWQRGGNDIVVSVTDNGIGIADKYFDAIFKVFERLHNQDAFPGTGIGLAVVKKSVELQGGKVWVTSVPGAGSTFHVQLPAPHTVASVGDQSAASSATPPAPPNASDIGMLP